MEGAASARYVMVRCWLSGAPCSLQEAKEKEPKEPKTPKEKKEKKEKKAQGEASGSRCRILLLGRVCVTSWGHVCDSLP